MMKSKLVKTVHGCNGLKHACYNRMVAFANINHPSISRLSCYNNFLLPTIKKKIE